MYKQVFHVDSFCYRLGSCTNFFQNHREQCMGMVVSLKGVNFTSLQAFKV